MPTPVITYILTVTTITHKRMICKGFPKIGDTNDTKYYIMMKHEKILKQIRNNI